MKSVVLVNPYQKDGIVDAVKTGVQIDNRKRPPVDLAYCSAALKQNGFLAKVLDANILCLNTDETFARVAEIEPAMVVIATSPLDRWECPYLNIDSSIALAQKLKQHRVSTFVAFIGPHGTSSPAWVFKKCPELNVAVQGEPEETVLELAACVRDNVNFKNIHGIAYKDEMQKNGITLTPPRQFKLDVDALPFPDYTDMPPRFYKTGMLKNSSPFTLVVSSRGCHYGCIFCLRSMWGMKYRARSVGNVMEELRMLKQQHGVRALYFQDLEFAIDYDRALALCEAMPRENLEISWGCSTRLDSVDEALLSSMKKAGCESVNFGLESGSQEVLNKARKGLKLQNAKEALNVCKKIGLRANLYMMVGLPGETEKSLNETAKFSAEQNLFLHIGNLPIPYPGTKLYELAKEQLGHEPSWDEVGMLAGKIGTELFKTRGEADVMKQFRLSSFQAMYGKFFMLRPVFWKKVYEKRTRIKSWIKNYLLNFKKITPDMNADKNA